MNTRNSTDFPLLLFNHLKKIKQEEGDFLTYIQKITVHSFVDHNFIRGMLIYHGMGYGKTIIAIAIAALLREKFDNVILLAAKSIHENFIGGIHKYFKLAMNLEENQIEDIIKKHFSFVALNAGNVLKQLDKVAKDKRKHDITDPDVKTFGQKVRKSIDKIGKNIKIRDRNKELKINDEDEYEYENVFDAEPDEVSTNDDLFYGKLLKNVNSFDNVFLIIDEAHNLFNSIVNGSYNAMQIYKKIMNAKNFRCVFLTGTPIINDPFELVPCYNMLAGEELLPSSYEVFYRLFVDEEKSTVKHGDIFTDRIFGLSSYYGEYYTEDDSRTKGSKAGGIKRENFPYEYPTQLVKVKMSNEQFTTYLAIRIREKKEHEMERQNKQKNIGMVKPKTDAASTYKVKSRQVCNCLLPVGFDPKSDEVADEISTNLHVYSPKFLAMYDNIKNDKDKIIVVYSSFVHGSGLELFAKVLERKGYEEFRIENFKSMKIKGSDEKINSDWHKDKITDDEIISGKKHRPRFAFITGDTKDRKSIQDIVNLSANKYGEIINIVLISPAGAEGLTFYNGRKILIMEPFWNMNRIHQVKARIIRLFSHVGLPENERDVRPYVYLMEYPDDIDEQIRKRLDEPSTDIHIYNLAIRKIKLINRFRAKIIEASVDCSIHTNQLTSINKKIKCKMCAPVHNILYPSSINAHIKAGSFCYPISKRSIKAIKIKYGDNFYHYVVNNDEILIYMKSEKIDGMIPMPRDHPDYSNLMDEIIKKINEDPNMINLEK